MVQKIKKIRFYRDVVEQIQEAIIDGTLKPGSLLPAERDLKVQLGVSRATLREALRVLEQKGLIEIRTGVAGGSIIRGIHSETLSENMGLLIRNHTVSVRDLVVFREVMEGGVAFLAAQLSTSTDIELLRQLLVEAESHFKEGNSGWDAFVRTDKQIHIALARMSRNQLIITIMESIYDNIHTNRENFLPYCENLPLENFRDLQSIVAAVTVGDAVKAREKAQVHVRRFNDYLEEKGQAGS